MCVLRLRFEGRSGEFVRNMLAQHGFIAAGEVILVVCVCDRQSVCVCACLICMALMCKRQGE